MSSDELSKLELSLSYSIHRKRRASRHSAAVTARPLFARWKQFQVSLTPLRSSNGSFGHGWITHFMLSPVMLFLRTIGSAPSVQGDEEGRDLKRPAQSWECANGTNQLRRESLKIIRVFP
mmetsp:Transcript_4976/g.17983  ORF Transcript_4976/g.17983 Transcript_4976/m.17983 type:complete len:120 (+) Transcript_4976:371-730(+)